MVSQNMQSMSLYNSLVVWTVGMGLNIKEVFKCYTGAAWEYTELDLSEDL